MESLILERLKVQYFLYVLLPIFCLFLTDLSFASDTLVDAVRNNNEKLVKELLKNGEDPNKPSSNGEIAIEVATTRKNSNIVKLLLKFGAKPTFLSLYNGLGTYELVTQLLPPFAKEDPNWWQQELLIHRYDGFYDHDSKKVMEVLIKNGLKPDVPLFRENRSLLHHIAEKGGHVEILKLLLKATTNPDIQDQEGKTILHSLVLRDASHKDLIKLMAALSKLKANFNTKDIAGNTPLMSYLRIRSPVEYNSGPPSGQKRKEIEETFNLFIKLGADASIVNSENMNVLHYLAAMHNKTLVNKAIISGARVNEKDQIGRTPLMFAGGRSLAPRELELWPDFDQCHDFAPQYDSVERSEVIKLLLKAGANPNETDSNGRTAIHDCANRGSVGALKAMIPHGARFDIADNEGKTPAMISSSRCYEETSLFLISQGANMNAVDDTNRTFLSYASARDYNRSIVDQVIQKVPDQVKIQDKFNFSALQHACANGSKRNAYSLQLAEGKNVDIDKACDGVSPLPQKTTGAGDVGATFKCGSNDIASLTNPIPETKWQNEKWCSGDVCTNLPRLYTRYCKFVLIGIACGENAPSLESTLQTCSQLAAATFVGGGIVAAVDVFIGCVAGKLGLGLLGVDADIVKRCPDWE